ncbi:MAG: hypothetical protein COU11_01050 [Candidatus Harrisonbacteria bacterium CG10_big_fil_rev_8_21_14_0_10_49_15]|uniref:KOW domain-containing protein n=1 Tax=Candidatus Harrisonbacteria bacterium CG10_big_fil_rev_8_21_14_0_10_49_15 TaxID=1974587 RepID=A0A2H0ULQ9_9BACT|nr:MAG: hypothetical protein COU11_01050 [Candidatus Harrisonbacteria bacterium CG10_big_fil_rev_8_21_14_0_10_49_15]
MRYEVGTRVVFQSKHGQSANNGKVATVILHGNQEDASGVAHAIKLDDGRTIWAYPQELRVAQ